MGAGILGKNGRKITQRDVELLLSMTGTDMGNLRMELEKADFLYRRKRSGDCGGYPGCLVPHRQPIRSLIWYVLLLRKIRNVLWICIMIF